MTTIKIAFDVDGTLRCNCTPECTEPNLRVVRLFNLLGQLKNAEMYVWSGGGADYALRFAKLYDLRVADKCCLSKLDAPHMDLAFDDQHDFDLGGINLIVREKKKWECTEHRWKGGEDVTKTAM